MTRDELAARIYERDIVRISPSCRDFDRPMREMARAAIRAANIFMQELEKKKQEERGY